MSIPEQKELAAIASAIIPTDSSGPGAAEAGVTYFIDNQLNGEYGNDGNAFTGGPFILPNTTGSVTLIGNDSQSITYHPATVVFTAAGNEYKVAYPTTTDVRVGSGNNYQYPLQKKEFWRIGLDSINKYSNAVYGGNFENLSGSDQAALLTGLWNNQPTAAQFQNIKPSDFAYELFYLVWAGFLMDPMYGGNQNMVGWELTGFNGVNMGNFYGEGYTDQQLMVASTPTRLKPASLGQFQQAAGLSISSSSTSTSSSSSSSTTTASTSSSLSSSTTAAPSSSSSSSSSAAVITIPQGAGTGQNFSPASLNVAPGTTITWTDEDTIAPHNVHFLSGPSGATLPAASSILSKGKTFTATLTAPGTYKYQCDFHATWMQGEIIVS